MEFGFWVIPRTPINCFTEIGVQVFPVGASCFSALLVCIIHKSFGGSNGQVGRGICIHYFYEKATICF